MNTALLSLILKHGWNYFAVTKNELFSFSLGKPEVKVGRRVVPRVLMGSVVSLLQTRLLAARGRGITRGDFSDIYEIKRS